LTNSAFKSDLVTIYVGPDGEKYVAHKDILTKAKYFSGCLTNIFRESETLQTNLPEEDPKVFEKLLEFLYQGSITAKLHKSCDSGREKLVELMVDVYVAADRYSMEECQNHIMDFFCKDVYRTFWAAMICKLDRIGLSFCPLRQFMLREAATYFAGLAKDTAKTHRIDYVSEAFGDNHFGPLIKSGGETSKDIFNACVACVMNKPWTATQRGKPCDWHIHNTTNKCADGEDSSDPEREAGESCGRSWLF